jgi:RHS repeat-associated protein
MAKDTTADATFTPQFFMPDVYSVQNYYAFGQSMPNWSSTAAVNDPKKYRFGYNGKEDDDEWGKQDYGFRISDPRIGRFLSVDPLAKEYPWYTPYQFAGNGPIANIDLDGLEEFYAADGSYLGKYKNIPEIRIVPNSEVAKTVKKNLAHRKWDHSWIVNNDHTIIAYKNEPEKTRETNYSTSVIHSTEDKLYETWASEVKVEKIEKAMMIFEKTLTGRDGKTFSVLSPGSTAKGEIPKDKETSGEVDPNLSVLQADGVDLEKSYDWKRISAIHTHTGGDGVEKFSNRREIDIRGSYLTGDIPWSITNKVNLYLVDPDDNGPFGKIHKFNYSKYLELNPAGIDPEPYFDDHRKWSEIATKMNAILYKTKK